MALTDEDRRELSRLAGLERLPAERKGWLAAMKTYAAPTDEERGRIDVLLGEAVPGEFGADGAAEARRRYPELQQTSGG